MKITYVIPSLGDGGAEIRAIERFNLLVRMFNIAVDFIVLSKNAPLLDKLEKSDQIGIHILGMNDVESLNKKGFIKSFINFPKLLKRIKSFSPDIVISSLPMSHQLCRLALFAISKHKRPKLIIYHHATQYIENPIDSFAKRILNTEVKLLNRIDDAHIFISNAVKKDIQQYLKVKNSVVLYNAIPDKYIQVKNLRTAVDINDFNIVLPGRLTPVKGHINAIKTLIPFFQEHNNVKLWIIGEGSEKENLISFIAQNNLKNKVKLTGRLSHEMLLKYIQDSQIVLIPSLSEGLGNVAIEALMMGTFIISSNAGGLPEIVNNDKLGYLFDKDNFDELLSLMRIVFNERENVNNEAIRNSYLERFTIENHVRDFYNFLRSI